MQIVRLKDHETIIDKYQIMTKEKMQCLGKTMKLKDVLDLYWNYVNINNKDREIIGEGYKDTNGKYALFMDDRGIDTNKLLNKLVKVQDWYECDSEDCPQCYVDLIE